MATVLGSSLPLTHARLGDHASMVQILMVPSKNIRSTEVSPGRSIQNSPFRLSPSHGNQSVSLGEATNIRFYSVESAVLNSNDMPAICHLPFAVAQPIPMCKRDCQSDRCTTTLSPAVIGCSPSNEVELFHLILTEPMRLARHVKSTPSLAVSDPVSNYSTLS